MSARSQAVRLVVSLDLTILNLLSWLRWHRPVTFGTAARLIDEERGRTEGRIDAIRIIGEAGLPDKRYREAARATAPVKRDHLTVVR